MPNKTILVIDDEPDQREIYRAVLQHAGYDVLEASSAAVGIRLAQQEIPDLILMDIALPAMDGWEAARRLKENEITAHIPLCAISARLLPKSEFARIAQAGFECYLLKPIEPRQVLREVAERIGPPIPRDLPVSG